jgi:hypothetical protein
MQSRPNLTTIKLNSGSLTAKTLVCYSKEKLRNTSTKCKPSLADRFDHRRLARLALSSSKYRYY